VDSFADFFGTTPKMICARVMPLDWLWRDVTGIVRWRDGDVAACAMTPGDFCDQ